MTCGGSRSLVAMHSGITMARAAAMTKLPNDVDHEGVDALLGDVLRLQ